MPPLPAKDSSPVLAAMIALAPLPGAPLYGGSEDAILHQALDDLERYKAAEVDAIVIENSLDLPYIKPPLDSGALALVLRICRETRARFDGLMGLQLLEAANEEALRIAAEASFEFVRVEGYVFAHVGGAGIIEGCAGKLHRLRRKLRCNVGFLADIKKKHCSHALTGDLSIGDVARQAEFFLADGVIVTGAHTGHSPAVQDLKDVRDAVNLPIWIGSGISAQNLPQFYPYAQGFIVGSTFREDGKFTAPLDSQRLREFMSAWHAQR